MENNNTNNTVGITLRLGNRQKRLWFQVGTSEAEKAKFKLACAEIESIGKEKTDWIEFLEAVEENYKHYGFDRVAK